MYWFSLFYNILTVLANLTRQKYSVSYYKSFTKNIKTFTNCRKKLYFCAMKPDFLYSTDFLAMNAPELSHTCMHLLCTAGEGSFVFNEKCYHIMKNDLVVMPNPSRAKNLAAAPGMRVEWFAADNNFLSGLLPSNNYSIGGSISLNQNPVIKVNDRQAEILLDLNTTE